MFQGFAHVWTPVAIGSKLRRKPQSVTVAGERVVLFRGASGKPSALLDRCPHRGVALSLGRVAEDGTLACPFHGWRFDGEGACTHVPLNPRARCERLGATALPVREAGGLLWLYTAPVAQPNEEPVIPEALADKAFVQTPMILPWRSHWTRAMENMLDMPHLPFVHRRTIGAGLRRRMRPDSEMQVSWEPTARGGRIRASIDGEPDAGFVEFSRPNAMTLHISDKPGRCLRMHVFCVPETAETTRMIIVSARDYGRYNPLMKLFDHLNRFIALEDKPIVESSSPVCVPVAAEERSVASDRATLQFRKYYFEELHGSSAAMPEPLFKLGTAA